jgi:DNA-binding beta-propeller fold protein YncE
MPSGGPGVGAFFPEGITANPDTGEIIVSTFDPRFDPVDNPGITNFLMRFDKRGRLVAKKSFGAAPLLGLAYNPADGMIYLCNFGASQIQRIAADFDSASSVEVVANVPGIGAPDDLTVGNPDGSSDEIVFGSNSFPAPNDLTFDSAGNLYFSDSFQGAIFRIDDPSDDANTCPADDSCVTQIAHDGLLATTGFPPFGANGVAFQSDDDDRLFVANTGDDRVLTVDVGTGEVTPFAESINGADGIAFDGAGRLWVAANQADQMVALDGDGKVVAKLGDFLGVRKDGAVNGLIFPASIVIHRGSIFVTNLALDLVGNGLESDISTYTVSRIKIPKANRGKK